MISKVIAGISGVIVTISACMVDSYSNAPIGVMLAGIALLGIAILINPEVFE